MTHRLGRGSRVNGARRRGVDYRCSFCGKSQEQVYRLIAGPGGVYICDECVRLCSEIIAEESGPQGSKRRAPGGPRALALLLAGASILAGLLYGRRRQRSN